jgi:hypothetical protein
MQEKPVITDAGRVRLPIRRNFPEKTFVHQRLHPQTLRYQAAARLPPHHSRRHLKLPLARICPLFYAPGAANRSPCQPTIAPHRQRDAPDRATLPRQHHGRSAVILTITTLILGISAMTASTRRLIGSPQARNTGDTTSGNMNRQT